MSAVGRLFASVFPGWALRRAVARVHLRHVSGLLSEHVNDTQKRLRRERTVSVEQDVQQNRAKLLAIARTLYATNSWAVGAVNSITGNVIGRGMRPESAIEMKSGTSAGLPDTKANDRVEKVFSDWAQNADLTGRKSLSSLQRSLYRERWIANDVFLRRHTVDRGRGRVPLALEVVSGEQLSDRTDKANGIVQGVQFEAGRPVAYHFFREDGSTEVEVVSADQVVHLFKPHRPGAVRGLSPMGPVWDKFDALKRYLNHELTRAQIASAFVFLHKTAGSPLTGLKSAQSPQNLDDHGNKLVDIYDGGGLYIHGGTGDSLESVAPAIQSTAFDPFVTLVLRSIATGIGISYELLARDFTRTNFSSARQSSLEDRRQWEPEQTEFIDEVLAVVWDWFVDAARLGGVVPFTATRAGWPVSWTPQGWQWVDPQKEVTATATAIEIGLDNPVDACRRLGRDLYDNVKKKAAAEKFAAEQGTSLGKKTESATDVDLEDEEEEEAPGDADSSQGPRKVA
jgi:lambda family phage portal protein